MKWSRYKLNLLTLIIVTLVIGATGGMLGRLRENVPVSGTVTRKGVPVADSYVLFSGSRGEWYITGTRSDGTFQLRNCRIGDYKIWAGPRKEWELLMRNEVMKQKRPSLLPTPIPNRTPLSQVQVTRFGSNRIELTVK